MGKVVIDLSISLDGFIAGPSDGREYPLGKRGGEHLFDWHFSGDTTYEGTMFTPKGANREVVAEMFERAGAMLTGRRTYDISRTSANQHERTNDSIEPLFMSHEYKTRLFSRP
jgi:dihydrofolate reductase